jgi:hypothetical protein
VQIAPEFFAKARELRDRWLEHVNSAPHCLTGKYNVARSLPAPAERAPLMLPPARAA